MGGMDNSESNPTADGTGAPARPTSKPFRRRHRPALPILGTQVDEVVVPPDLCARCQTELPPPKATGRTRIYCSPACRKVAYEDRRAKRPGAVQTLLVDRIIFKTIQQTITRDREPSRSRCVQNVLADPTAVHLVLIGLSRQVGAKKLTPDDGEAFVKLAKSADYLHRAFIRATNRHDT